MGQTITHINELWKKLISILIMVFICVSVTSCHYDNVGENDFYNSQYRTGIWITDDRKDTLQFVDAHNLIRKGYYYSYEKYLYRVSGTNLYLRLPNSTTETQHSIYTTDGKIVKLGNMYLTIDLNDNSGTFFKIN